MNDALTLSEIADALDALADEMIDGRTALAAGRNASFWRDAAVVLRHWDSAGSGVGYTYEDLAIRFIDLIAPRWPDDSKLFDEAMKQAEELLEKSGKAKDDPLIVTLSISGLIGIWMRNLRAVFQEIIPRLIVENNKRLVADLRRRGLQ